MANTTVGASVQVEFASVGQMRKAIKEATSDLIAMQEQFGKTSPQAIAAAKRIAELKDRIQDAKEQADLFDPGKRFSAFANAANQVAAGFSAVQGALALAGTESKDLEKTLVKVQGAVALSQGLSQLKDLGKAYDELKVVAVDAFSSTRKALVSVGIGALAIALTAIIANWDKFRDSVYKLIPGLQTVAKFIGNLVTSFTDFVGITSEAERNLEKLTKSNKKLTETIDAQIKILEAQGGKEAEIYAKKKERIEGELSVLRESLKVKGKLSEDELKQFRDLKNEQTVLDIQEKNRIKKANEDAAKEQDEKNKKAAEKLKADNEKKKQIQDAADKAEDEARRSLLTERQRQEEDALKLFNQSKETLQKAGITNFLNIELQYQISLKNIKLKFETEEKERLEKEQKAKLEKNKERQNKDIANKQAQFDKIRAAAQEDLKDTEEVERQKQQLYSDTANALGVLGNVIGQETAAGKALAIAQATINTWLGVTEVLKQKSVLPEPAATVSKIVNVAAIVASGLKAVSNIVRTQVPKAGGGGSVPSSLSGGGAAPVSAQPTPTVTAQALNAQAINQLSNQSARAYILNSDIQNNEQRNAYLQRNARLG